MAWLTALLVVALVAAVLVAWRASARAAAAETRLGMTKTEAGIGVDDAAQIQRRLSDALKFLSHDARSPHSSVLSLIELHRLGAPEAADVKDLLARIRRYAQTGLAESEDFLQLAHAEAGQFALREEDLYLLLAEAIDMAWARARERRIRIELPDPEVPALTLADRSLLTRAFRNLLDNAVASSPEGTTIRCEVSVSEDSPEWWQVSIRDEGPGLEVQDIELMFEKFRKTTGDVRVQGSPFAMAFVKAAVTGHGGTISALNCTEQGAEFRICLPRDGRLPAREGADAADTADA